MELVKNFVEKFKVVYALFGLTHSPGNNTHSGAVDVSKIHKAHILIPDFGGIDPLVGVIISAVDYMVKKRLFHTKSPLCRLPFDYITFTHKVSSDKRKKAGKPAFLLKNNGHKKNNNRKSTYKGKKNRSYGKHKK